MLMWDSHCSGLGSVSGLGKAFGPAASTKGRFYQAAWHFFCSHTSFVPYHPPRSDMYRYTSWRPVTITIITKETNCP
jgi:hypothetical protein